ncbi:MAG: hypothetical protein JWO15_1266 [Sphingomonadales bacterium]|nr:hypothetical protein [Sphingomonadales bacterium]
MALTMGGTAASAQQIEGPHSVFAATAEEYKPYGLQLGEVKILPTANVRIEYDDNIYAAPSNRIADWKLIVVPRVDLVLDKGKLQVNGVAEARIKRFFERKSENSTGALVGGRFQYKPSDTDAFAANLSGERVVEDRGDPEARTIATVGPRLFNSYNAEVSYERSGRIGFDVHGGFNRLDYLSTIDAERDHDNFSGSARISYEISGTAHVYARSYAIIRKFRQRTDANGVNRDAKTYGLRAGMTFDPGGRLSGDAAIGLFRFDPTDTSLKARTGFSAQASLAYELSQRTSFTFDAFRGDVATVQRGAQSRTDTRLQLGLQQEIRHNFRVQAGAFYRRTNFVGSGIRETTKGGFGEVEYLFDRHLSVAATGRYADRSSSDPFGAFDRLRVGLELRFKY